MRASKGISSLLPTGRTVRSCSDRRSFGCMPSGISPISSKKSVPPLACKKRPGRAVLASVNAPLAWPNSSDSSSVSGTAAQLMATNGPAARRLRWWIARAMSSLPVPLSP